MNDLENILSRAKGNLNYISGTQLRFGTSLTSEVHNRIPGANDDQFVISWIPPETAATRRMGLSIKYRETAIAFAAPAENTIFFSMIPRVFARFLTFRTSSSLLFR